MGRITRPELIGTEGTAVVDGDGFAAEIANAEVVIDFQDAAVDDDVTRVRDQIAQAEDHREATGLRQGIAAHVEHGSDVIQGDAETISTREGRVTDHTEVVDRAIGIAAGVEECPELTGAGAGNHEELVDGRARSVQVEGTPVGDGDVATFHADRSGVSEF